MKFAELIKRGIFNLPLLTLIILVYNALSGYNRMVNQYKGGHYEYF